MIQCVCSLVCAKDGKGPLWTKYVDVICYLSIIFRPWIVKALNFYKQFLSYVLYFTSNSMDMLSLYGNFVVASTLGFHEVRTQPAKAKASFITSASKAGGFSFNPVCILIPALSCPSLISKTLYLLQFLTLDYN